MSGFFVRTFPSCIIAFLPSVLTAQLPDSNSNLFSTNRATSITEWESGPRINYGIEWFVNSAKGPDIITLLGQNYRFNKHSNDKASDISDYFINTNININLHNYLDG